MKQSNHLIQKNSWSLIPSFEKLKILHDIPTGSVIRNRFLGDRFRFDVKFRVVMSLPAGSSPQAKGATTLSERSIISWRAKSC